MNKRVAQLEQLARDLVGDGRQPNLYFVTLNGKVDMVTVDKDTAMNHYSDLGVGAAVEDRLTGLVAGE